MKDLRAQAEALREEMIACRRDLHRHPETAYEEFRTAGIVAQTLTELGLEVQTGIGKTGVVGVMEGAADGPTVMVRCDMDALPIQEENDAEYRSQVPHKMHACGHDGHTSIALALAKLLSAHRHQIKGRIKFVFQPAEEVGSGAQAMITDGVLAEPMPDVAFGLHLWSELPIGEVVISPDAMMAGAAIFTVEITGKGGHAAQPNDAIDPVVAAAQMITALQTVISRSMNPLDTGVLSVTQVHAGDAFNVIPTSAVLHGTFRTFTSAARDTILRRLGEVTEGVAQSMNCQARLTYQELVPPLVNDQAVAERLEAGFRQIAPDLRYHRQFKTMISEDMGIFLQHVPGVFLLIGAAPVGQSYPHHHPRFDINEDALVIGASLLAAAVSDYVL